MGHRTRLAPPAHLSKQIPTKLASGAKDLERLLAAGWTIVQANGETLVDEPHNGASTDVPEHIGKRIEDVLGEAPRKKRPRIQRPAP